MNEYMMRKENKLDKEYRQRNEKTTRLWLWNTIDERNHPSKVEDVIWINLCSSVNVGKYWINSVEIIKRWMDEMFESNEENKPNSVCEILHEWHIDQEWCSFYGNKDLRKRFDHLFKRGVRRQDTVLFIISQRRCLCETIKHTRNHFWQKSERFTWTTIGMELLNKR